MKNLNFFGTCFLLILGLTGYSLIDTTPPPVKSRLIVSNPSQCQATVIYGQMSKVLHPGCSTTFPTIGNPGSVEVCAYASKPCSGSLTINYRMYYKTDPKDGVIYPDICNETSSLYFHPSAISCTTLSCYN